MYEAAYKLCYHKPGDEWIQYCGWDFADEIPENAIQNLQEKMPDMEVTIFAGISDDGSANG